MRCDEATRYVDAFADGELGALRRLFVRRHLAACPGCAARVDEALALQSRIRAEAPRFAAPAQLRARVLALRDASASTASSGAAPERRWMWAGSGVLAGCALSVLVWFGVGAVLNQRANDDLALVAVNAHVNATLANRLTEVASSDQHTVKPWLSSHLDYSPPVRDLAAEGFPLAGARIDYIEGRPVAALVYRYRQHTVDVFVRPARVGAASAEPRTIRGFNVLQFAAQDMDWLVVSDASTESLAPLLRELAGKR